MIFKIKNYKYYFLLKFRLIFLNFKYLIFIKIKPQEYINTNKVIKKFYLNYLKVKFNYLNILFVNKYINNMLNNNYFLIYFNDLNYNLKELKNFTIDAFSFSGYFVNLGYINQLNMLQNYYANNFNIYLIIVYKIIYLYIILIYIYVLKLLALFLKFGVKKNIKLN